MSPTALRRAVGLSALLIALSLALGYVHAGGTFAIWSGEAVNKDSAFAAGWIPPPTSLGTPTPSGYGASLVVDGGREPAGHRAAAHERGRRYRRRARAAARTARRRASAPRRPTPTPRPGRAARTGTGGATSSTSTSATAWTSAATAFTPIRVGLIPTGVVIANGGTAGTLDNERHDHDHVQPERGHGHRHQGLHVPRRLRRRHDPARRLDVLDDGGRVYGRKDHRRHRRRQPPVEERHHHAVRELRSRSRSRRTGSRSREPRPSPPPRSIISSTGSAAACTACNCVVTATGSF